MSGLHLVTVTCGEELVTWVKLTWKRVSSLQMNYRRRADSGQADGRPPRISWGGGSVERGDWEAAEPRKPPFGPVSFLLGGLPVGCKLTDLFLEGGLAVSYISKHP